MLVEITTNSQKMNFGEGLSVVNCQKIDETQSNNRIGKTTLVSIINFIYGGQTYFMARKERSRLLEVLPEAYVSWKLKLNQKIYSFRIDLDKIEEIRYEGSKMLYREYQTMIDNLIDNKIEVFEKSYRVERKFIRKSLDSKGFKYFFPNQSDSVKGIFMIKLLGLDQRINNFDLLYKYFAKVMRRNSYRFLRSRYHKDLINQITENKEITDIILKNYEDSKRLNTLKRKLKHNFVEVDRDVIVEIKELQIPNLDLEKIREFHDKILKDYQDVISIEIENLKTEIAKNKNFIRKLDFTNYKEIDVKIASEVTHFIEEETLELIKQTMDIKEDLLQFIEDSNHEIKHFIDEYNNKYIDSPDLKLSHACEFVLGRGVTTENGVIETLKFNINRDIFGRGENQLYFLFNIIYANILVHSKLNVVVLDTSHTEEISGVNLKKLYNSIQSIIGKRQFIIVTFSDKIYDDVSNPSTLGPDNCLFGIRY